MKDKLKGLALAILAVVALAAVYGKAYSHGKRAGMIESDKYWIEAVVSRHLAYMIKQEGRESFIEFRYVPKVRKCPVIHRDQDGNEINKGGIK